MPSEQSSYLWLDLIIGFVKRKEDKMNRKESPKACVGVIPENRREKLAVLKKAIAEGAYKVKAADIAEKILKERLFELAITAYHHKYQNWDLSCL